MSEYTLGHDGCMSITTVQHHSRSGDLLLGCNDGVRIINRVSGEVKHLPIYPNAHVVEHNGELFISSHGTRRNDVKIYQHFLSNHYSGPLFAFTMKEDFSPHFTVCDQYVVSIGITKR